MLTMDSLIMIEDGIAKVSAFTLAEGFGINSRSMDRLIKRNIDTLNGWGQVEKLVGGSSRHSKQGGHNKVEYFLNEQQALLVMMYTGRTEKTNKFRVDVINAFMDLKKGALTARGLLDESIKMLDANKQAGSNWGVLSNRIKQERKPILASIENANDLLQVKFNFEGV